MSVRCLIWTRHCAGGWLATWCPWWVLRTRKSRARLDYWKEEVVGGWATSLK